MRLSKFVSMESQSNLNYGRIAAAIEYLREHFREQPSLETVAAAIHLSPAHFQRIFSEWAGVSPKQFLQYLSLDFARARLRDSDRPTLFDTALETGLSSPSRLHELFVNIEAMTPAEYRDGGSGLVIQWSTACTSFGPVLIASTDKGICHLMFFEDENTAIEELKDRFPNAGFEARKTSFHDGALQFFHRDWQPGAGLKLHLRGTPFQLKVWEALLRIPMGQLRSYAELATAAGNPTASRAVGSAIGSNPVAFLIPCHRVIRSDGGLGGYMWGEPRKQALIGWEALQVNNAG
jgi:AraC family transcriptional regulator of adaptative response/methylated-DNA-[protein]-cysteine methyltransferase